MIKKDTIIITNSAMAGFLMFCGFGKVGEKPDLKDRNRNIYIFNDSENLRNSMQKYNQFKQLIHQ